jgi:hypothetical protein
MLRGIGSDTDDVEGLCVQHGHPVVIGVNAGALLKTVTTSGVPAAAANQIDSRVTCMRVVVCSIEATDGLTEGVTRDLVGATDESQSDDPRPVARFAHLFVLPIQPHTSRA